jgi:hypothetical protein
MGRDQQHSRFLESLYVLTSAPVSQRSLRPRMGNPRPAHPTRQARRAPTQVAGAGHPQCRLLPVDTLSLVLRAKVHRAGLQDWAAVPLVLDGAVEELARLEHLWVDQGYTGAGKEWVEEQLGWSVEVVKHPSREASGNRAAISTPSLRSGLSGFDFHPNLRDFAVLYRGAG